ncbi:hypothetical protein WR25_24760 [Diploscapter pachys]|uniref:Uncharacterized protein n=1 Tax=Diploscapter pachys TaxID=2018661 RepID=A0A2A2KWS7_9BILA|nr:hypothetical protein WR25_24760 [Diploscapter pachys]
MSIKDYVAYKLHSLRDLDYRYNLNLGAKFRPGEVVDFEYLSAAAKKLRYGARQELGKKIEELKLMHSNFQLRMYSKMQYEDDDDYGNMMHSEPIYEGDEDIPHPMDLVHIEQLPHVITPPNNHTTDHQYSNLTSSMNSSQLPPDSLINLQSPENALPPSQGFDPFAQQKAQQNAQMNNGHLPTSAQMDASKSKADAWLDDVFRQSLTLSSPPPGTAPSNVFISPNTSGMQTSTSSSSWASNMVPNQPPLQRPQTINTMNGGWTNQRIQSLQSPQTPDLLVFDSPLTTTAASAPISNGPPPLPMKAAISNGNTTNGSSVHTQQNQQGNSNSSSNASPFGSRSVEWDTAKPVEIPKPVDPFDIMWSNQMVARANGTPANS